MKTNSIKLTFFYIDCPLKSWQISGLIPIIFHCTNIFPVFMRVEEKHFAHTSFYQIPIRLKYIKALYCAKNSI